MNSFTSRQSWRVFDGRTVAATGDDVESSSSSRIKVKEEISSEEEGEKRRRRNGQKIEVCRPGERRSTDTSVNSSTEGRNSWHVKKEFEQYVRRSSSSKTQRLWRHLQIASFVYIKYALAHLFMSIIVVISVFMLLLLFICIYYISLCVLSDFLLSACLVHVFILLCLTELTEDSITN